MKKHFGMCISLYIVCSAVQLLDHCLLLGGIGNLIQPESDILFIVRYMKLGSLHMPEPDCLLEQMIEITKELLLPLPAGFAYFFYPFHLGYRTILQDRVQPLPHEPLPVVLGMPGQLQCFMIIAFTNRRDLPGLLSPYSGPFYQGHFYVGSFRHRNLYQLRPG